MTDKELKEKLIRLARMAVPNSFVFEHLSRFTGVDINDPWWLNCIKLQFRAGSEKFDEPREIIKDILTYINDEIRKEDESKGKETE